MSTSHSRLTVGTCISLEQQYCQQIVSLILLQGIDQEPKPPPPWPFDLQIPDFLPPLQNLSNSVWSYLNGNPTQANR